jgi:hypothetical protein
MTDVRKNSEIICIVWVFGLDFRSENVYFCDQVLKKPNERQAQPTYRAIFLPEIQVENKNQNKPMTDSVRNTRPQGNNSAVFVYSFELSVALLKIGSIFK